MKQPGVRTWRLCLELQILARNPKKVGPGGVYTSSLPPATGGNAGACVSVCTILRFAKLSHISGKQNKTKTKDGPLPNILQPERVMQF